MRGQHTYPICSQVQQLLGVAQQTLLHLLPALFQRVAIPAQVLQQDGVVDADRPHEVRVQPQQSPLGQPRLDVRVVIALIQQHQVRVALQVVLAVPVVESRRQPGKYCFRIQPCFLRRLLLHRFAQCVRGVEEHAVQQVDRQVPPERRAVDRVLVPDREVEFGAQRVQQHVYLVHDQNTAFPQVQYAHQGICHVAPRCHHVPQPRNLLVVPGELPRHKSRQVEALQRVQLLDELQLQRLDRFRSCAHHSSVTASGV
mmetsp:Transcript_18500/g.36180  ORF Transcript_18500/g.36180 Transcript_18500/m.36180 type:complete len:256 (-) Transcript_18500:1487-2254(-)